MAEYPKADFFEPAEFTMRSCSKCDSLTARLAAAEASRDDYHNERQQMRDLLPECLEEYGPDLVGALRNAMQRLAAAEALLREAVDAADFRGTDLRDCDWWGNEIPDEWFVRVVAVLEAKATARQQLAVAHGNRVSEKQPRPHTRYVVLRDGKLFTATPCYGIHEPWWVAKTMASRWPDEAGPEPMQPDDIWWPLGEYLLRLAAKAGGV